MPLNHASFTWRVKQIDTNVLRVFAVISVSDDFTIFADKWKQNEFEDEFADD